MDQRLDVRFPVVPFLPAQQPALGISSLISVLGEQDIHADAQYLNLAYGEKHGWDFYVGLVSQIPTLFLPGEMLFAKALWGDQARSFDDYDEYLSDWVRSMVSYRHGEEEAASASRHWWFENRDAARAAFDENPMVVKQWADEVLEGGPRVIGFTSTFQQNVAALALAKEIRSRVPREEVAIMFGGANCESDMGRTIAEVFPFVDCVVSGEGEQVVVGIVRSFLGLDQGNGPDRFVQGRMVTKMDDLPLPEFDHYFSALGETSFPYNTYLSVESSRGCWWGVKSHCTFCGLNGGSMAFRSKGPGRFASELEALSQKYGTDKFAVTDNILDMKYLKTVIPDLIKQAKSYSLFYETKSNLRKDQVELMAAAGVSYLQPGIESFSTDVLRLMAKGTTRLQNAQLLKWCQELGVAVTWNLLYGFPGEDPKEYEEMAEILPSLFHLTPPGGCSKIRLDRFGPYWKDPDANGIANMRHTWSYEFAYPELSDEQRDALAYFFDFDYEDGRDPYSYALDTVEAVVNWREAGVEGARLNLRVKEDGAFVYDSRPHLDEPQTVKLTDFELALLRSLDGFKSSEHLHESLLQAGFQITAEALADKLKELEDRRYLIQENDIWLSVVIDLIEIRRVADRKVALRAENLGLKWPEDFPDPQNRQLVRAAMLQMDGGSAAPIAGG